MSKKRSNIFFNMYSPKFNPEEGDIVKNFAPIRTQEQWIEELKSEKMNVLQDSVDKLKEMTLTEGGAAPKLLVNDTEKEAVRNSKEETAVTVKRIENKLLKIRTFIDDSLTKNDKGKDGKPYIYSYKRKPRLKKAMKSVFGASDGNITWEQYKAAMEMKKVIELTDMQSLASGDDE